MEWFYVWEQKRVDFRGCRPGASCQPASRTPRCLAWRPWVCTTPGDRSGRRPGQQTERQPRGKGSWNSRDLPEGRADTRGTKWTKCDDGGSTALTTRHTEGGPDILCTPVRSERRAVDDGIGRVSRHHRTETVASASHSHKNCGYAITWRGKTKPNNTWASPLLTQWLPSTHLRIRLWCEASHLGLCAPRWLSGCRESQKNYRPFGFFHSGPCLRWIPLTRQPCLWPDSPAAAKTQQNLLFSLPVCQGQDTVKSLHSFIKPVVLKLHRKYVSFFSFLPVLLTPVIIFAFMNSLKDLNKEILQNKFSVPQPFQRPTRNSSSPSALPQGSLLSGLCTPTDNRKRVIIRLCMRFFLFVFLLTWR